MRIYFDNCIFQELKRPGYEQLVNRIIENAKTNLFCFSEAHAYDLSRDLTKYKASDMEFMEEIVGNHCWCFSDKAIFEYHTPSEYYNMFDWEPYQQTAALFEDAGAFSSLILEPMKLIPLNWNQAVTPDQFPDTMPPQMKDLFTNSVTLYDFMMGMLKMTDELNDKDQIHYRNFLKYLHGNAAIKGAYEAIGIEGWDGTQITDKQKLRTSYTNYFKKWGERNDYDCWIDLYNGLENFGFVKGKPAKQKMTGVLNDARHAYFGAFCDLVVSKDDDFIRKIKFLFELFDIEVPVIHMQDFEAYLTILEKQDQKTFIDLVGETVGQDLETRLMNIDETGGEKAYFFRLTQPYFSYINMLAYVTSDLGNYFHFTKAPKGGSPYVLTKEIQQLANRLVKELGPDTYGQTIFDHTEIIDGKWDGRTWFLNDTIVFLNYNNDNIYITLYPETYVLAARNSS